MGNYSQVWSSETPGYLIFLLDQSGSMKAPYPEFGNKATFAARVINRTIFEVIMAGKVGEQVRNRAFISIIGYGNPGVNEIKSGFVRDFYENPLRLEPGKQKVPDGNGGFIEIDVNNYVWIEPVAIGSLTSMGKALELAQNLVNEWINANPNNPAPVIINISDGLLWPAEDKSKALKFAKKIMELSCSDGNPLLFNCHIGDGKVGCIFPESEDELSDEHAKFLFSISSKLPDYYKYKIKYRRGLSVKANSKCFLYNADTNKIPEMIIHNIQFGS